MPEGHTLFRLARDLDDAFAGVTVRVGSPQGRFEESAAILNGSAFESADSWGKHLFLWFADERIVHVHLGLYGSFEIRKAEDASEIPLPVGAVRLRVHDAAGTYADLRGPTTCALIGPEEREAVLARSGPDPLRGSDPTPAWERIRRSRTPIGALLMDQTVVAGVGNVYRAEVLFRQKVHPLRPGNTLRVGQWTAIWEDLVALMAEGVRLGRIDTVRPEHTPEAMGREPRVDDHGGEVYVYRRAGAPCLVCSRRIRAEVLAGRNLFWCGHCQRAFRSRALS